MAREFLLRTVRPARPLRRNVQCIAFMASTALVAAMMAQNIRVRLNVLDSWHYVAPIDDMTPAQLHELLHNSDFKYIAVVTFLVTPTGSNGTFNVPPNWNSSNNKVECIGGGASGGAGSNSQGNEAAGSGGGGGAYAAETNITFVPGATATYQIAAVAPGVSAAVSVSDGNAGNNTWFNASTFADASVGAVGGSGGIGSLQTSSGVNGGQAASCIGSVKVSGGGSGSASTIGGSGAAAGSGGGGAAGPNGAGSTSSNSTSNSPTAGGSGDAGSGGAGGSASFNAQGGTGGNGTEFDASHGCGGGGGGFAGDNGNGAGGGGNYGGGGGGAGTVQASTVSGAGAQGLIVVTNTVATRAQILNNIVGV